jgi:serine/threonine protein kinase
MTPTTDQDPKREARAERVARLIEDVRAARAAGKDADDQAIIRANPDLVPDLDEALGKLRRVQAARDAAMQKTADGAHGSSQDGASLVDSLFASPAFQTPGYSIVRELSRGGQAVVYLALQLSTGRNVAMKVMRDGPFADERAMARFKREVQALAALNHPNIVTIFDTGQTSDGSRYLAMNYIPGRSLDEYMQTRQQKPSGDPSKLLRLFLKICAAVSAAHLRDVVHRDLKPSNIRIDDRGESHILDFGLARLPASGQKTSQHPVSITGEFLGTLPWSSPEQAEGDPDKIDQRTDVYSLGVILYQMLTGGRFPYAVVGNIRDVLNNILTAVPTPPSKAIQTPGLESRSENVNKTIEKIVLKALAKKREDRYQSAGELGKEIARYLAGQPTAGEAAQATRTTARGTGWMKLAAFAACALILGGTIVLALGHLNSPEGAIKNRSRSVSPLTSDIAPPPAAPPKTPSAPITTVPTEVAPMVPVIEARPPEPSSIPTDAKQYRGHHYKFFADALSWNEAAARCREMGGHLVRAVDPHAQTFLQKLKGSETTTWLGGRVNADGRWEWEDGRVVDFAQRPTARQQEHRWMFLSRNGTLLARPESGRIEGAAVPRVEGFICEWD